MDNQNMNNQNMNNQGMNDQNMNAQGMNNQNMNNQNMNNQNMNYQSGSTAPKEKMVAGLLGIFLGSLGIHKFYLGYTTEAIIMLAVTIVGGFISLGLVSGVMGIIGLIEGIIYLTKSDEEFQQMYVYNHKGWF